MAVTLGDAQTPQASSVIFMDGFEHYDDLSQKWTSVVSGSGSTPAIVHEAGTYYGLQDTTPIAEEYDQYEKERGGLLYIDGTHYATARGDLDGTWPHLTKLLQRQGVQRIICALNIKADEYTGVPFLRYCNEAGDIIVAYAITPEGNIVCCRGTEGTNMRFPIIAGAVKSGVWTEVVLGIGLISPENPGDYTYEEGFWTRIEVNDRDIDGYGGYYAAARTDCQVYEIKLGAAGTNTYISDFVCHMGMINETAHVHALKPLDPINPTGQDTEIYYQLSFNLDDMAAWPPSPTGISLTGGCYFIGFYLTEAFDFGIDPLKGYSSISVVPITVTHADTEYRYLIFMPFFCDPDNQLSQLEIKEVKEARALATLGYLGGLTADKEIWMHGPFKGLEYHTYATCQVNALAEGSGFAFGVTEDGPDWDSNYLQYIPRGSLKFDITQLCHRHPYLRYMWSPMELSWHAMGIMALPEDIEGDARYTDYWPPCWSI